ncbi:MAG: YcxB family protein [Oscillospiraceae bacterium]|nr:YcxB family protein [Oscillospiraceae bacterium]
MLKINYDNTIDECETAFMLFWRKYSMMKTVLYSLVFVIGIIISASLIWGDSGIIGWILLGLSAGFLLNLWLKPRRTCKKLAATLTLMNEEKYRAFFSDNDIEIETIISCDKESTESEEASGESSESDESEQSEQSEIVENSVYSLLKEEMTSRETAELFLLFVNRSLIYTFPKRCMSEKEINGLREYFVLKKI